MAQSVAPLALKLPKISRPKPLIRGQSLILPPNNNQERRHNPRVVQPRPFGDRFVGGDRFDKVLDDEPSANHPSHPRLKGEIVARGLEAVLVSVAHPLRDERRFVEITADLQRDLFRRRAS